MLCTNVYMRSMILRYMKLAEVDAPLGPRITSSSSELTFEKEIMLHSHSRLALLLIMLIHQQSLWYMCKFIVHSLYMESIHCMATSTNASVGTVHCHLLLVGVDE